jgi:hypothetical protein
MFVERPGPMGAGAAGLFPPILWHVQVMEEGAEWEFSSAQMEYVAWRDRRRSTVTQFTASATALPGTCRRTSDPLTY